MSKINRNGTPVFIVSVPPKHLDLFCNLRIIQFGGDLCAKTVELTFEPRYFVFVLFRLFSDTGVIQEDKIYARDKYFPDFWTFVRDIKYDTPSKDTALSISHKEIQLTKRTLFPIENVKNFCMYLTQVVADTDMNGVLYNRGIFFRYEMISYFL